MVNNVPDQPDIDKIDFSKNFSKVLKEFMEMKVISQSDLVKITHISKGTISRMLKDTNYKGNAYLPTLLNIMAVCVAMKLTPKESKKLFFAAYPELSLLKGFLENGLTVMEANEILEDNGLAMMGNIKEE